MAAEAEQAGAVEKAPLALERRLRAEAGEDLARLVEARRVVEQACERERRLGIAGMERERAAHALDARLGIAGGEALAQGAQRRRTERPAGLPRGRGAVARELARQLADQAPEIFEGPACATSGGRCSAAATSNG